MTLVITRGTISHFLLCHPSPIAVCTITMPSQTLSNGLYGQSYFKVTRLNDVFSFQVCIFNLHSFTYFCSTKDQTQGLTWVWQAFYAELSLALFSVSYFYKLENIFPKCYEIYIKAITSAQWKLHSIWKEKTKRCLEQCLYVHSPSQIQFLLRPELRDNELFSRQSPELLSSFPLYQKMLLLKCTT